MGFAKDLVCYDKKGKKIWKNTRKLTMAQLN
jgi:hypothetical protein